MLAISLLPEYKDCLRALDDMMRVKSCLTMAGQKAAYACTNFLHPVHSYYPDRQLPKRYSEAVTRPMVLGDVTTNLIEGEYKTVAEMEADVGLVFANCRAYFILLHGSDVAAYPPDVSGLVRDAEALELRFKTSMDAAKNKPPPAVPKAAQPKPPQSGSQGLRLSLGGTSTTSRIGGGGSSRKSGANQNVISVHKALGTPAPPAKPKKNKATFLKEVNAIMVRVKSHEMKSKVSGHSIPTAKPFLEAVDPRLYPDYFQVVEQPIDLRRIDRSLTTDKYWVTPMSLVYDMRLLRDNCHLYNTGIQGLEVRLMSDALVSYFEALYREVIRRFEMRGGELEVFLREKDEAAAAVYMAQEPIEAERKRKEAADVQAQKDAQRDRDRQRRLAKEQAEKDAARLYEEAQAMQVVQAAAAQEERMRAEAAEQGFNMSLLLPGKHAAKGSKSSKGSSAAMPPPPMRESAAWELACDKIFKRIAKHDYCDLNRTTVIANFFMPVVDVSPDIREEYLAKVEFPMDLGTLQYELTYQGVLDSQDFFEKITRVFQNTVTFTGLRQDGGEFAKKMCDRCSHMVNLIKWLSLEQLPVVDDEGLENPEEMGPLRVSNRQAARDQRKEMLTQAYVRVPKLVEMLLKKLESSNRKEMLPFRDPIKTELLPTYYQYVRRPMDITTIRNKLATNKYANYWQPVEDLRLVFNNARIFNGAHMQSDPISKTFHNYAVMLGEKLEVLVWTDYSIDALDRLMKFKLSDETKQKIEQETKERLAQERAKRDAIFEEEKANLMRKDPNFAFDQDRDAKRRVALAGQGKLLTGASGEFDDDSADDDYDHDDDGDEGGDDDDDADDDGDDEVGDDDFVITGSGKKKRKKKRGGKGRRKGRGRQKSGGTSGMSIAEVQALQSLNFRRQEKSFNLQQLATRSHLDKVNNLRAVNRESARNFFFDVCSVSDSGSAAPEPALEYKAGVVQGPATSAADFAMVPGASKVSFSLLGGSGVGAGRASSGGGGARKNFPSTERPPLNLPDVEDDEDEVCMDVEGASAAKTKMGQGSEPGRSGKIKTSSKASKEKDESMDVEDDHDHDHEHHTSEVQQTHGQKWAERAPSAFSNPATGGLRRLPIIGSLRPALVVSHILHHYAGHREPLPVGGHVNSCSGLLLQVLLPREGGGGGSGHLHDYDYDGDGDDVQVVPTPNGELLIGPHVLALDLATPLAALLSRADGPLARVVMGFPVQAGSLVPSQESGWLELAPSGSKVGGLELRVGGGGSSILVGGGLSGASQNEVAVGMACGAVCSARASILDGQDASYTCVNVLFPCAVGPSQVSLTVRMQQCVE